MDIKISQRLESLPTYAFAAITQHVAQVESRGHSVIRLDMGSPDMPPPQIVLDAMNASAADPAHHGYQGYQGIKALREAFRDYYGRRFEVELDADREILPLIGSKEGIVNIGLALLNPGDVVLVPDIAYPAYASGAHLASAQVFDYRLDAERGFLPDLTSIPADILRRARLMWINYPHNPTGAVITLDELANVVEFCQEHEIVLCSDNPYCDIAFDGFKPPSLLEIPGAVEIGVEFNSISKTFNMAGWRIGVCAGNASLVSALLRVKSNIDSGMFRVLQDAACVALNQITEDWIAERNAVYQRRRDIVLRNASKAGLEADVPRGGLYVWAKVLHGDDEQYAHDALENAYVSVTPGRVYGEHGKGYVRISLVTSETQMQTAMDRLAGLNGKG